MPRPGPRPYECVRRAWHSDRHQPIRGSIIQQIFRLVNQSHSPTTRKNREWQEKLPIIVFKAEEILYSKANSEAEYVDSDTLWDRLNDAVDTIIRKEEDTETEGLLQPCIEAALVLGCIPVRGSRSQRNSNPRSYLNQRVQPPSAPPPQQPPVPPPPPDKPTHDRRFTPHQSSSTIPGASNQLCTSRSSPRPVMGNHHHHHHHHHHIPNLLDTTQVIVPQTQTQTQTWTRTRTGIHHIPNDHLPILRPTLDSNIHPIASSNSNHYPSYQHHRGLDLNSLPSESLPPPRVQWRQSEPGNVVIYGRPVASLSVRPPSFDCRQVLHMETSLTSPSPSPAPALLYHTMMQRRADDDAAAAPGPGEDQEDASPATDCDLTLRLGPPSSGG